MDNEYNNSWQYIKLGEVTADEAAKIAHEKGCELCRMINRYNSIKDYEVAVIPDNE